jgi:hypothetical protein
MRILGENMLRFGVLFPFLFLGHLAAKDIAVLIDVSGTMRIYGAWQSDARHLTESILLGRPTNGGWSREGDESGMADFRLDAGDRVRILRFGSIRTQEFPYFEPARTISDPGQLETDFPTEAATYRELRTNKPLAIAVGARLASEGEHVARLIVISDFLVDSNITGSQQRFINEFEAHAKIESPLIYSWQRDSHVQVKLLRVQLNSAPGPLGEGPCSVQIKSAKVMDSPRRLALSWALAGCEGDVTYSVSIREQQSNKTILTRKLLAASLLVPNPPTGKFVWRVTASLASGQTAASGWIPVEVPGGLSVGALLLGLAVAGTAAVFWQYSKKRKPRSEEERKEKAEWKA